jgi:phospholipase C
MVSGRPLSPTGAHLARGLLATLLGAALSTTLAAGSPKINNVVVLMLENRPFDHIFGWASDTLKVNGLTGKEFNYADVRNTSSEKVFVNNKCPYINDCDPSHGTSATTFKVFAGGDGSSEASNGGFAAYEASSKALNYCDVMSGFPPEKLPVINSLASEFAVMDRFFASHPGPTWPNRMYTLSGTSAGSTETYVWYHNMRGKLFPQETIFDQLEVANLTWRNYYNDTPWELFMEKIAHSPDNLKSMESFYKDAAAGSLPSFSWINPRSGIDVATGVGSNDQHPNHDMNAGEQYIKDIYEALRASPQWEETLFIITYDEHGGFYDHVIPPSVGIPEPGDDEPSYPVVGFKFDRLGLRVPTLLISPWIAKGTVISEPSESHKPTPSSQFDLTSIIATTRRLLGMPTTPLTDRDGWAATFDYVVDALEKPRDDCPVHLPDALPPTPPTSTPEHALPLNDLQKDIADVHAVLANVAPPTHTTQGPHSAWVQTHYKLHEARTVHWKSFKASPAEVNGFRLVTQTCPLYVPPRDEATWNVNGIRYGGNPVYASSAESYITVSSKTMRVTVADSEDSVPICLDAGTGVTGSKVTISPCYPNENPSLNRDAAQHFVMPGDGTLRFFDAALAATPSKFLCVTNSNPFLKDEASMDTYLRDCGNSTTGESVGLTQSWAYHGAAPGEDGDFRFEYGDITNCMGIISV